MRRKSTPSNQAYLICASQLQWCSFNLPQQCLSASLLFAVPPLLLLLLVLFVVMCKCDAN